MEEIREILEKDEYFRNKEYRLTPIQKRNKNHKFLLEMEQKKYILIVGEKRIQKYQIRFHNLDEFYKALVGLEYINPENNILLLTYYGIGDGIPLANCHLKKEDNELIAKELKELLDTIHKHTSPFINLSTRFENKSWYEFIYSYMQLYANYALEHNDLSQEDYDFIFQIIEKNKNYFDTVSLNFLHGDINEDNVCFNKKTKESYLIDYDDFLVGDTLYEYARMFQYEISAFQIIKEKYYSNVEENTIFLIYLLRNYLLEYCFEKENGFAWENSSKKYHHILEKLKRVLRCY